MKKAIVTSHFNINIAEWMCQADCIDALNYNRKWWTQPKLCSQNESIPIPDHIWLAHDVIWHSVTILCPLDCWESGHSDEVEILRNVFTIYCDKHALLNQSIITRVAEWPASAAIPPHRRQLRVRVTGALATSSSYFDQRRCCFVNIIFNSTLIRRPMFTRHLGVPLAHIKTEDALPSGMIRNAFWLSVSRLHV